MVAHYTVSDLARNFGGHGMDFAFSFYATAAHHTLHTVVAQY